jgi:hypothetical protein
MKLTEILGNTGSSKHVEILLMNLPSQENSQSIVESVFISEAGTQKNWGNGYTYRLDRRPPHHGGDQIHIYHKNGAWAYRQNGTKSELNKYTTPATNEVKNIVRDIFSLAPNAVVESYVVSASPEKIVFKVWFD